MKNNTFIKGLAMIAVGSITYKTIQIIKERKIEKEIEEVVEEQ